MKNLVLRFFFSLYLKEKRPFHGFFTRTSSRKSVDMAEKNALELVENTNFERNPLKTNKDIVRQSHRILQTFVRWGQVRAA